MNFIGIDAGTTSVSGVLLNAAGGRVEEIVSVEHGAALAADNSELDIQDPQKILDAIESIKATLLGRTKQEVRAISVTGQVHGILYIDADGHHVSPLYTWQDTRGTRPLPAGTGEHGESWSDWASKISGYLIPPGYGFLTHLINQSEERVPADAEGITSILGYISMRLSETRAPKLETSDAHSLGLYNLKDKCFDVDALETLNIARTLVPEIVQAGTVLGTTREGIEVFAAVGDNQAGYVGSVQKPTGEPLVSIGTSAQLSVFSPTLPDSGETTGSIGSKHYGWEGQLEIRPFPGGAFLLAGASITGGSSYRLLETLFREICRKYAGEDPGSLLEQMNAIPYEELEDSLKLDVSTQFLGTRLDPSARGAIRRISRANFTHDYLVEGFLRGIVAEIKTYFNDLPANLRENSRKIIGVGNALRRNPLLRKIIEQEFTLPLRSPAYTEEAALGAAIIAGVGAGAYDSYTSEDRPVSYESNEPFG
ncbi:MAG: sedoheptulokinase [Spirochaetales bacterium]